MRLISEEHYKEEMNTLVLPDLDRRRTGGYFARKSGEELWYERFLADSPRGALVLVHGFTEGIDKFRETVWYFLQAGYHVWLLQQREHGKSYRSQANPEVVAIPDYRDLVKDLHAFVNGVVKKDPAAKNLPRVLFAHSMGGGVGACVLEQYPDDFEKAVLSSPMMEISAGSIPMWAAAAFAGVKKALGRGTDPMPGSKPFSETPDFENSCTNSRARYDYWFDVQKARREYQTCMLAVCTASQFLRLTRSVTDPKNTSAVKAEVLLLQAGKDNMVCPGGQETFIEGIGGHGRMVRFPEAKHEIYACTNDILEPYWKEILDFLET